MSARSEAQVRGHAKSDFGDLLGWYILGIGRGVVQNG